MEKSAPLAARLSGSLSGIPKLFLASAWRFFPPSQSAITGGLEDLRPFAGLCSGRFLRHRIIFQHSKSGLAENRIELCLELGKHLIQQGGDLPLEAAGRVYKVEAVSAQLPQGQQILLRNTVGLVASKTYGFHNERSVEIILFGLLMKRPTS